MADKNEMTPEEERQVYEFGLKPFLDAQKEAEAQRKPKKNWTGVIIVALIVLAAAYFLLKS
jgi:hypothetical protein